MICGVRALKVARVRVLGADQDETGKGADQDKTGKGG